MLKKKRKKIVKQPWIKLERWFKKKKLNIIEIKT